MRITFYRTPEGEGGGLPPTLESLDSRPIAGDMSALTGVPTTPPAPVVEPAQPIIPPTEPVVTPPATPPVEPEPVVTPPEEGSETPPEEDDTIEETFWEVTEKITGRAVPVEYPEGVAPDTPEGAAIRENAVREQAYDDFENDLRTRQPRGFAYMLHLESGGTDDEFFNGGSASLILPTEEEFNASVDVQTRVYKSDLMANGLDSDEADALIAKAAKENKLQEKAKAAYVRGKEAQASQLKEIDDKRKAQEAESYNAVVGLQKHIDKGIASEISVIVPETERAAFKKYILDQLEYDTSRKVFRIVQTLDTDNLKTQLEMLFLDYKKGDLSKIIGKKAETIASQKLKLQARSTKTTANAGPGLGKTDQKRLTLGEI